MGVISVILLVLFIIASVLLIVVVAVQSESGTGLGGIFGGGSDSAFGSQSGKVMNKITAIIGISFLVLAILLALANKTSSGDLVLTDVPVERMQPAEPWWIPSEGEKL